MRILLDNITLQVSNSELFVGTSWTIEPYQTWAILGPTGAGKSTLAAAICRRLPLTHGQIHYIIQSADTGDTPAPHATAPESRSFLYPGEILTFAAETHRAYVQRYAGYVQARWQSLEGDENPLVSDYLQSTHHNALESDKPVGGFDEIVRMLSLLPLLDRQIHRLSNGESRKVFLAHLLLSAPRLLILDDPYNGLDGASRLALSSEIDAMIARANLQILLITSRPEDLPAGITHILGVKDGRVHFQGLKDELLNPIKLDDLFTPTISNAKASSGPPTDSGSGGRPAAITRYAARLGENANQYPFELIEMQDVNVTYDQAHVLQGINWKVRQGERWLVSGPNGAGKTSLLSLVLADNPQSYANLVTLFGRRRGRGESIWAVKRVIGWVSPELQAFYSRPSLDHAPLTCLQVACSGYFDSVGLYHTVSPDQKAAAVDWLTELGLEGFPGQLFQRLSNGQQRLALLARALVKNPPLLVLDEPCQALDRFHRQAFTGLVDALCAVAPVTLLYVTHDPAERPACITHHLRLERGRIVEIGPIQPISPHSRLDRE